MMQCNHKMQQNAREQRRALERGGDTVDVNIVLVETEQQRADRISRSPFSRLGPNGSHLISTSLDFVCINRE